MSDTSWKRGPRVPDSLGLWTCMEQQRWTVQHMGCCILPVARTIEGRLSGKRSREQPCVWWWWRRRHIAWHTDLSSAASILRLSHNSTRHANLFQRLYALLGPFPHNRDLETHFMSDSIGYARSLRSCWWKYIADNIRLMAAYAWTCVRMSCWWDLRFRIALHISFRNCSAAWSSYCYAAVLALLYQR